MAPDHRERPRRVKVALACEPCRERKSRCDGGKPICASCQRRCLRLDQCIYKSAKPRGAGGDDYTKSLQDRIRQLEQVCSTHGIDLRGSESNVHQTLPERGHDAAPYSLPQQPNIHALPDFSRLSNPSDSPSPQDQVDGANNESGVTAMGTTLSELDLSQPPTERETFFGRSSTFSFLQEAYPSFSIKSASTLRPQLSARPTGLGFANLDKFHLPHQQLADHLVQRYFAKVFYLYPFFDRLAFEHAYHSLWQPNQSSTEEFNNFQGLGLGSSPGADSNSLVFHCALNAIFALGCTFSDIPQSEKTSALDFFFQRSKDLFGLPLLDMNNLSVVQTLLIISLLLQGTSFPDRCWNTVGVACRMAQGLGLHTNPTHPEGKQREVEIRRRTWHGCVILDMLVSMTLGRPNMTTTISLSIPPSTAVLEHGHSGRLDQETLKLQFSNESITLNGILENILLKVYQPASKQEGSGGGSLVLGFNNPTSLDTVVGLQSDLESYEQSTPTFLSWLRPELPPAISDDTINILKMQANVLHARFLYLKLLLHRPMLARQSVARNPSDDMKDTIPPTSGVFAKELKSSFTNESAKSCIEAAVQLINLIYSTYRTGASGGWWWDGLYACTAGLVLVFARLCPALEGLDLEVITLTWDKCKTILEDLASYTMASRKSLEILLKIYKQLLDKQTVGGSNLSQQSHEERDLEHQWTFQENSDGDSMFQLNSSIQDIDTEFMEILLSSLDGMPDAPQPAG
ncbi:fungal-specific transcription factor domain-containing protein [Ilyonectria sp. MPI-CAGE-AT-0026]|nr:fungal-specific transcription factor domain-containing protein [Ilyonectria sp. MPI-CAGE-AT-0026]